VRVRWGRTSDRAFGTALRAEDRRMKIIVAILGEVPNPEPPPHPDPVGDPPPSA
jgi:hypothetical protein